MQISPDLRNHDMDEESAVSSNFILAKKVDAHEKMLLEMLSIVKELRNGQQVLQQSQDRAQENRLLGNTIGKKDPSKLLPVSVLLAKDEEEKRQAWMHGKYSTLQSMGANFASDKHFIKLAKQEFYGLITIRKTVFEWQKDKKELSQDSIEEINRIVRMMIKAVPTAPKAVTADVEQQDEGEDADDELDENREPNNSENRSADFVTPSKPNRIVVQAPPERKKFLRFLRESTGEFFNPIDGRKTGPDKKAYMQRVQLVALRIVNIFTFNNKRLEWVTMSVSNPTEAVGNGSVNLFTLAEIMKEITNMHKYHMQNGKTYVGWMKDSDVHLGLLEASPSPSDTEEGDSPVGLSLTASLNYQPVKKKKKRGGGKWKVFECDGVVSSVRRSPKKVKSTTSTYAASSSDLTGNSISINNTVNAPRIATFAQRYASGRSSSSLLHIPPPVIAVSVSGGLRGGSNNPPSGPESLEQIAFAAEEEMDPASPCDQDHILHGHSLGLAAASYMSGHASSSSVTSAGYSSRMPTTTHSAMTSAATVSSSSSSSAQPIRPPVSRHSLEAANLRAQLESRRGQMTAAAATAAAAAAAAKKGRGQGKKGKNKDQCEEEEEEDSDNYGMDEEESSGAEGGLYRLSRSSKKGKK